MITIASQVNNLTIKPGVKENKITSVAKIVVINSNVTITTTPAGTVETMVVPLKVFDQITTEIKNNNINPTIKVNTINPAQIIYGGTAQGSSGEIEQQIIKQTSEDIVAFKVVAVINNLAEVADSSNLNHIWAIRGIAVNSVLSGGDVTIKTEGELSNGSWNWNMSQGIWFNSAGSLTQIQPVVGFGQVVAEPISPTRIYVKLRHPVRNN